MKTEYKQLQVGDTAVFKEHYGTVTDLDSLSKFPHTYLLREDVTDEDEINKRFERSVEQDSTIQLLLSGNSFDVDYQGLTGRTVEGIRREKYWDLGKELTPREVDIDSLIKYE